MNGCPQFGSRAGGFGNGLDVHGSCCFCCGFAIDRQPAIRSAHGRVSEFLDDPSWKCCQRHEPARVEEALLPLCYLGTSDYLGDGQFTSSRGRGNFSFVEK